MGESKKIGLFSFEVKAADAMEAIVVAFQRCLFRGIIEICVCVCFEIGRAHV